MTGVACDIGLGARIAAICFVVVAGLGLGRSREELLVDGGLI